jgi:hypothetical protein
MDMYNILLFAVLGAVLAVVATGGLAGMVDQDASALMLGGSAVLGAGGAAAVASFMGGSVDSVVPKSIMSAISSAPDMKVGLPNF